MASEFAALPFKEQIEFLRQKTNMPTNGWRDVQASAHDRAFVVAGATKMELLADFRQSIDKAITEGRTLGDFRRDFDSIVAKHGWEHKGEPAWRAKTIYSTNVRQSYNAGREAQFADPEFRRRRPIGVYRHSGKEHFRPLHKAWNGKAIPLDDPWWDTHTPMNGHGCGCDKYAISHDELALLGKDKPDEPPNDGTYWSTDPTTGERTELPRGVDPGFQYRPGAAWLKSQTPQPGEPLPAPIPVATDHTPLPPPRVFDSKRLLQSGRPDEEYVKAFLGEFGADVGKPVVYKDAAGEPLMINEELFKVRRNNKWKVSKGGRERYLSMLAETIRSPDEIWARMEWIASQQRYAVRRRYIARWMVDDEASGLAVFEYGADGWSGITTYVPEQATAGALEEYIQAQRQGVRLFQREVESG